MVAHLLDASLALACVLAEYNWKALRARGTAPTSAGASAVKPASGIALRCLEDASDVLLAVKPALALGRRQGGLAAGRLKKPFLWRTVARF